MTSCQNRPDKSGKQDDGSLFLVEEFFGFIIAAIAAFLAMFDWSRLPPTFVYNASWNDRIEAWAGLGYGLAGAVSFVLICVCHVRRRSHPKKPASEASLKLTTPPPK